MTRTPWLIALILSGSFALSGCAALFGAGAAIGADQAAEDEGRNIF